MILKFHTIIQNLYVLRINTISALLQLKNSKVFLCNTCRTDKQKQFLKIFMIIDHNFFVNFLVDLSFMSAGIFLVLVQHNFENRKIAFSFHFSKCVGKVEIQLNDVIILQLTDHSFSPLYFYKKKQLHHLFCLRVMYMVSILLITLNRMIIDNFLQLYLHCLFFLNFLLKIIKHKMCVPCVFV